ncbi:VOC family protein [Hasllibacter sp. MH4015]|uniref:VOC family protein n=1 Tax=Hasllibacter sp. MH4015 TaxID=2854029 RepID=UPI001CD20C2D|nr:VOC family protein [Hasllibacter sp. MH4015]
MQKVDGIGGLFFVAKDADALAKWYRDHLGIDLVPGDYDTPPWTQEAGETVFAPFTTLTSPMTDAPRPFMVNFRVSDLEAMIAQLESAGITVKRDPEVYPNGTFAWLDDPEGNPIELWQPA